ncbi:Z1 domain-containing protein [Gelidibacter japonicus]|uniref:Z1 domain-containing protein n=1 Tax=Gelidibacter japonicus TaxID=1962232 RepID=UPI0020226FDB|nr:Z1 domain-containing protein [Gelidibacter japonicus]MCL8007900.1 Z1 domain-containing protein [Gelidibacter japonicus]
MVGNILRLLERASNKFIEEKGSFTEDFYSEEIRNEIRQYIEILNGVYKWGDLDLIYDKHYVNAERQHRAKTPVTIAESNSLRKNVPEWLTETRQNEIGWESEEITTFRDRYFKYLEKIGRKDSIIKETKRSTLNIVKNLGDPNSNTAFYKKGMVVGSVQSGKTANFNGVINSALDTGYKVIIVLSGIMEDLRVQTQKRIEYDVIGTLGAGGQGIGVGEDHPFHDVNVISITSDVSDFKKGLLDANFNLHNQRNILICKKNVSILRNILLWLNDFVSDKHPKIDLPLLIIDDEADNASLNNLGHKGREYATRTNMEIRSILSLFSKKSYLGYTATPFANVLQDRNEAPEDSYSFTYRNNPYNFQMVDNLFPDDFIELLFPPSNYIGIKHFFDTKGDDIIKIDDLVAPPIDIDDPNYFHKIPPRFLKDGDVSSTEIGKHTRAANKVDNYPNELDGMPNSLKEAIKCFIISIAIRLSRSSDTIDSPFHQKHHTMLVHISLFTDWQNRLLKIMQTYVDDLKRDLLSDGLDQPVWAEFERIWNKHYFYIINNITNHLPKDFSDPYLTPKEFSKDIKPLLSKAVEGIEVMAINSSTDDNLVYPKDSAKKYIAIGGNRLSRGFTLEGLTINYFLRKAGTADTLMQMGRWFGYRPGYLDCCKLFTTSDNIEKFNEASIIMEDLEEKFKFLSKLPNRTPSDYTLWIKNNPDVIKLTRGNFLKGANVMSLDFSDTVEQATQYDINKEKIINSLEAFKALASTLEWKTDEKKGFLIHDTNVEGLMKFINLPGTMLNLNTLGLDGYLKECTSQNKLQHWRVAVKSIHGGEGNVIAKEETGLPINLKLVKRSGPNIGNETNPTMSYRSITEKHVFKVRNSAIITPKDMSITLTPEEINEAEEEFKKLRNKEKIQTVPDRAYRSKMDDSTGILVIYFMDLEKIFKVDDEASRKGLEIYATKHGIDSIYGKPLIGYAIGFPTVTGVDGGSFITQHVFKELKDMTLDELKAYIEEQTYDIEDDEKWTRKKLLEKILEVEDEIITDELPADY